MTGGVGVQRCFEPLILQMIKLYRDSVIDNRAWCGREMDAERKSFYLQSEMAERDMQMVVERAA